MRISHSERESLPPDTATSTLSPRLNISYFLMKRSACSGTHSRKWSLHSASLCCRMLTEAFAPHFLHFIGYRYSSIESREPSFESRPPMFDSRSLRISLPPASPHRHP